MKKTFQKVTISDLTESQIEDLKESVCEKYRQECRKQKIETQVPDHSLTQLAPGYIRLFDCTANELATVYCEIDKYTDKRVIHMICNFPEASKRINSGSLESFKPIQGAF